MKLATYTDAEIIRSYDNQKTVAQYKRTITITDNREQESDQPSRYWVDVNGDAIDFENDFEAAFDYYNGFITA